METDDQRARLAEIKTALDFASGALVDAGSVQTDDVERGIRQLTKQRAQLEARVRELEHRLEIDVLYDDKGQEQIVPPADRDKIVDGIACRDITIQGLDERVGELNVNLEQAEAQVAKLRKRAKEIIDAKGSYDCEVDRRVLMEYERAYAFLKDIAAQAAAALVEEKEA